ncbi:hypothetical protein FKW77_006978 [Venturia effusa]|uniref:Uncharacterized protein n=1 Tax=Venturia effusa TaxID=50376 RepID=A0A517LN38_9PEZI|nr:hypothetical protein FKW77_006978 [Venturia effusa]
MARLIPERRSCQIVDGKLVLKAPSRHQVIRSKHSQRCLENRDRYKQRKRCYHRSTAATGASVTSAASAAASKPASSASQTAVHALSSSTASVTKSASTAANKASSNAATATKNGAAETGAGRMMRVVVAGALGGLML